MDQLKAAEQGGSDLEMTAGLRLVSGVARTDIETPFPSTPQLRTLEVYVSAFRSFRAVGRFQEALQALPGVHSVQLRGLRSGTLQLRIKCSSFHEVLADLQEGFYAPVNLVSREAHQVELRIEETGEDEWDVEGLRA